MIKNLVLGGSGPCCITYLGVLRYLKEINKLDNIKNYYGSSSGSLINLLLILEYNLDEIEEIFLKINFDDLVCYNIFKIEDIIKCLIYNNWMDMIKNMGVNTNNKLEKFIKKIIKKKINNKYITFLELKKITKKNLYLKGFNITDNKLEIFSYKHTPNMPVFLGILISCSPPVITKNIIYNSKIYCDGGMNIKYPLNFVSKNNNDTLIIKVKELISNINCNLCKKILPNLIIIDIGKIYFSNYKLKLCDKLNYLKIGYETAKEYFDNNNYFD